MKFTSRWFALFFVAAVLSGNAPLGASASALTIDGGTLTLEQNMNYSSATIINSGGATFHFDGPSVSPRFATTFSGLISGAGSLRKTGNSTLTLTHSANSYSGGTIIADGTVSVSADGQLGASSGPLTLSGGSLAVSSGFSSARTVSLVGSVSSHAGEFGNLIIASGQTVTLSGLISGT
eukprot:gene15201-19413_t